MNKKVYDRIKIGVKKFRPILEIARNRDINESDTVRIITDMLDEIFGWDKYNEITAEYAIRGQYCDLAIKYEEKLKLLIEVKAINENLRELHLRQAVTYAATQGNNWVVLTNGVVWQIYRIRFEQPLQYDLVFTFDFLQQDISNDDLYEMIYTLSKEAAKKRCHRRVLRSKQCRK